MIDRLQLGVVGAGYAAHVRARAIARLASERLRVVAVTSRRTVHARRFAAELGVAAFDSLEDMLQSELLNAVVVAVPNRLHYDMVRSSLEAGRHVLCEYPLVLDRLDRAQELVGSARRRGLLLHVGQTMNHDADHRFLSSRLDQLGRLYLGYRFMSFGALGSWFGQDGFAGDYAGLGEWYVSDTTRGGWIVSAHYHGIQVFRRLFGEVLAVAACDSTDAGVSAASVLMWHRGGASTCVQWGMPMAGQPFNKTVVSGSRGSFEVESGRYLLQTAEGREKGALPEVDSFVEDLRVLLELMDGSRDAEAETADMLANLEVAMAAERSAATGRVEKIRE
jgi:predicted dehydrogenase